MCACVCVYNVYMNCNKQIKIEVFINHWKFFNYDEKKAVILCVVIVVFPHSFEFEERARVRKKEK